MAKHYMLRVDEATHNLLVSIKNATGVPIRAIVARLVAAAKVGK